MYKLVDDSYKAPYGCDVMNSEEKEILTNPFRHDERNIFAFDVIVGPIKKKLTLRRSNNFDNPPTKFGLGVGERVYCRRTVFLENSQTRIKLPAKEELRGFRIDEEIFITPYELADFMKKNEQIEAVAKKVGVQLPSDWLLKLEKYRSIRENLAQNPSYTQAPRVQEWLGKHFYEVADVVDDNKDDENTLVDSDDEQTLADVEDIEQNMSNLNLSDTVESSGAAP